MVMIREFRIPMPFTLEEYKRGQKYSVARTSNENTSSAEGIELLENKPCEWIDPKDPEKKVIVGVYTKKIYHLKSLIPGWLSPILPNSALKLYEDAWDTFPYCKTVLSFPFLGDRFVFTIISHHTAGELGLIDNIHDLEKESLKKRSIEFIDIAKDMPEKKYYKKEEDPTIFTSKASGKGPLKNNWQKEALASGKLMCCYKLVRVRCKITGFQNKIEKFMINFEKALFSKFHQQVFCWQDEWFLKSMIEIIEMESKLFSEMNNKLDKSKKDEKEIAPILPPESAEDDEKDPDDSKNEKN